MAIHKIFIREGGTPPDWAIEEAERASKMPINYDDIPPMTDEEIARLTPIVRALRQKNVPVRITKQMLDHPEMLKDCL